MKSVQYRVREFICIGCEIKIKKRTRTERKYCSLTCYRKSKRPNIKKGAIVNCRNCGTETYKNSFFLKHNKNHFCSHKCASVYQGRNKIIFTCKTCGIIFKWSKSRLSQANPTYCSIVCRNADKERMLQNSIKGNFANLEKNGLNRLEKAGNKILDSIGMRYESQVLMFNKFLVDILIEQFKLVIQWDGLYWHLKPKRIHLDKSQDAYMNKCGYHVLRITDRQIKESPIQVKEDIINAIDSQILSFK